MHDPLIAVENGAGLQACGIEPVFGSVTAKQATSSRLMMGGSQRRFCSSVPKATTGLSPNILIAIEAKPALAAPVSVIACTMVAASVMPRPEPPYSSGMAMPSQPASAIASQNASGNTPSVSRSSQY